MCDVRQETFVEGGGREHLVERAIGDVSRCKLFDLSLLVGCGNVCGPVQEND